MKTLLRLLIGSAVFGSQFYGHGNPLDAPILTMGVAASFDFDQDGVNEFDYAYGAAPLFDPPQEEYYRVTLGLRSYGNGRYLRATAARKPFQATEEVSSASSEIVNQDGSNWMSLGGYDEARFGPDEPMRYIDITKNVSGAYWRGQLELFIGIRSALDDGPHHGWFHFTRPDTEFTTAFHLTASDWNPLPGEPIGAGQPPVIPLAHEITSGGLRLSWSAAVAGWVLESSEVLGAGAEWVPVAEASGTEALLPPPDGTRFYRLRRP